MTWTAPRPAGSGRVQRPIRRCGGGGTVHRGSAIVEAPVSLADLPHQGQQPKHRLGRGGAGARAEKQHRHRLAPLPHPFRTTLGALLPIRVRNLLPVCKYLGVTHITNGCYRLHPAEWNSVEAAGPLAAHCLEQELEPHRVRQDEARLKAFQALCVQQGLDQEWPRTQAR
ncbi:MAG: FAD-dependent oxidoreductase [Chloroflexota bacterium]|nr:FAD-dependent oxidoreductase [Chloroflexota bacterium]